MSAIPRWTAKLLRIVCPEHLLEEIEGDLMQKFHSDTIAFGLAKARNLFTWRVIRYIRPGILLRNRLTNHLNSPLMFRTHFKVAFRHIAKNKIYSCLNIIGLAIATATAFLMLQYINFELSFDNFHQNKEKIYRIITKQQREGRDNSSATTFYGVGTFLKQNFPEVEEVARCYKWPASTGILMMADNKIYNERSYVLADREFFKVFPSFLWSGDPTTCLSDPNSIVISKHLALKIFGTVDVLGKTVQTLDKDRQQLRITGVLIDVPVNSSFDLEVVRPRDWIPEGQWEFINDHTYVVLKDGVRPEDLQSKLNLAVTMSQRGNIDYKGTTLSLQSISDVHLNPQDIHELKYPGNKLALYLTGAALVIVLLVAWMNHVNFDMSQLLKRIKEVAVRRIIGSTKRQLIGQFLIQYIATQLLAFIVAGFIIFFALPYFPMVTGVPITSINLDMVTVGVPLFGFFVTGIFISSIYPAFVLMKTDLSSSLKGKLMDSVDKSTARKTLVVFQFSSTLIVTSLVIIVTQQINLMKATDVNANLDRIVTIYNPTNYSAYEDSLRQEKNAVLRNGLLQHAGTENLTSSSAIPGEPIGFTYVDLAKRTLSDPDRQIPYKVVYIDYDFIPVFRLKLKAGRNYDPKHSDTGSLVVTESTIRELGFNSADDAVGKEIYFMEDEWDKWTIIGVVEDYHHEAAKVSVHPTIFRLHRNQGQMVYYSVQLDSNLSPQDAIATIKQEWNSVWPEKPFDYFFLDEYYDQQFNEEVHFKRTFLSFSAVAILTSCLGIVGLTLMIVNLRRKELSIRKVLGASVSHLAFLLSKDNLKSVAWSCLISIPLIYWLGSLWLKTYPVKADISLIAFAFPLLLIIVLIALASAFQIIRAARANPVNHLRSE